MVCETLDLTHKKKNNYTFFCYPAPCAGGGYEGVHHTPSVIWFRAYSSMNLCMAFVSSVEIRTPALVVRSQSSVDCATPQLAHFMSKLEKYSQGGHVYCIAM